MDSATVIEVTDQTYAEEVESTKGVVLLDVWAPWCGPCRVIAPVVEQIAEAYAGKVKVVKLNSDDNPDVVTKLGVRALPTLVYFKDGEPIYSLVGAQPRQVIERKLDELLS